MNTIVHCLCTPVPATARGLVYATLPASVFSARFWHHHGSNIWYFSIILPFVGGYTGLSAHVIAHKQYMHRRQLHCGAFACVHNCRRVYLRVQMHCACEKHKLQWRVLNLDSVCGTKSCWKSRTPGLSSMKDSTVLTIHLIQTVQHTRLTHVIEGKHISKSYSFSRLFVCLGSAGKHHRFECPALAICNCLWNAFECWDMPWLPV